MLAARRHVMEAGYYGPLADAIIWVDYPRWLVMTQAVRRSLGRVVRRAEYYGDRERLRDWLSPTHPIRWSWTHHARKRAEYEARYREPQYAHLVVRRFRVLREGRGWLESL